MKWFLKCFYGYRNLWDEILFRWVLDYIHQHYPAIDTLTVEVQDAPRMNRWFDENISMVQSLGLGWWFVDKTKSLHFVEISKDIRDNFSYDMYFFGWGEVFAESRWFHGGWNYYFRYFFVFPTKPFVLLGWIETPTSWYQKLLYKYILPKAQSIVCRDPQSYATARLYNTSVKQWHDFAESFWAFPVADYKGKPELPLQKDSYILVNLIKSMVKEENFEIIKKFIALYPDADIIYVGCGQEDNYYGQWLVWLFPQALVYNWTEHLLSDTLSLFAHASAGIGCRLHFLLLLQLFSVDRYALVYAEKVKKLITSTITLG